MKGDEGTVQIKYSKVLPECVMIGMKYCSGGSLQQYVNGETMDEFSIKSFAYRILTAMLGYSEKGIVHGNIKPENILIDELGKLKISDFGLARDTYGQSKLSSGIGLAGTRRYLSPELEKCESQSEKSDVWAFGVVILELAYGRDAFLDLEIIGMDRTKIREEIKKRKGYSCDMIEFLERCFERESADRATVEELLRHEWIKDVTVTAVVSTSESGNNN